MEGFLVEGLSRLLGRGNYQPLNTIEISRKNLIHNFKFLQSLNRKIKIAPVLKSNAYGHGLIEISKILDSLYTFHVSSKIPFLCVDSLYEAYELLKANIKTPILIMGYINPANLQIKKLPFSYAVFDLKVLANLAEHQEGCGVHLFVDTGMGREGISIKQLPIYLEYIKKYPQLKFEGLMSHLASAERKDGIHSRQQIKNYKLAKELTQKAKLAPKWFHLFATKAIMQKKYRKQDDLINSARIGLAIFGIDPLGKDGRGSFSNNNLKPVLKLTSKIAQIKKIKKGEFIGYGGTYRAKQNLTVGILPIGYFDGVDRRLSKPFAGAKGKGFVKIGEKFCPIIGIVSMNITTVDISDVPKPKIGDEVVIFSNNTKDLNSIANCAKICKTIPYELLVHLAPNTKRVVV